MYRILLHRGMQTSRYNVMYVPQGVVVRRANRLRSAVGPAKSLVIMRELVKKL
jgi:hypothetical protein